MEHAQRGVAGGDLIDDDAKAVDVGDLCERQVLVVHLAVDRKQGFFAAVDAHGDASGGKCGFDLALGPVNHVASSATRARQGFGQGGIAPGMQMPERQVLQLAVGGVQAEPVRNRRVDVQGFAGDASPFGARQVAQGAHIVGAVGQLDQDDPYIAGHGQQHLAKGLGLVFLAGVEGQLLQLGQPVDQLGHRRAETLDQLGLADAAVLDRIVQQRSHQGLGVKLPVGALRGHGDRMGDVGLATFAHLPQMGLVSEFVGPPNHVGLGLVEVAQLRFQHSKAGGGRIGSSRVQRLVAAGTRFVGFGQDCTHGNNVTQAIVCL